MTNMDTAAESADSLLREGGYAVLEEAAGGRRVRRVSWARRNDNARQLLD